MIHYYIMAKVLVDIAELSDPNEARRLLGIGYATLYRWIKSGRLIPLRIGGRTLIPQSEIERMKLQQEVKNEKAH